MSIAQIMTHRSKLVTTMADASLASLREVFAKARFQHVPVTDASNAQQKARRSATSKPAAIIAPASG